MTEQALAAPISDTSRPTSPPTAPATTLDPPEATPSPLRELLRPVRGRLLACCLLMVISTLAGLVPLIGIVELSRTLLPGALGVAVDVGRAWLVVWISVAALGVRLLTVLGSSWLSHTADLDL